MFLILRKSEPQRSYKLAGWLWSQPGWLQSSEASLAGSEAWLAGSEACLAGSWALEGGDGRTEKWMNKWTDERTNERTENLPILQDFVPYRGPCPATAQL